MPPGWTDWHATIDKSTYQMYGYRLYENGVVNRYGNFDVEDPAPTRPTCCETRRSPRSRHRAGHAAVPVADVRRAARRVGRPGSTTEPFIRPPRATSAATGKLRLPRAVRRARRATSRPTCASSPRERRDAARIRADFRSRRESLIAVDEAVEAVVGALARTGRLDSTYVLFTSDNGFFQGEHNIAKGKYLAYDPPRTCRC